MQRHTSSKKSRWPLSFFRLGLPSRVLGYLIKEFQERLFPCACMVPRQRNSETCFGVGSSALGREREASVGDGIMVDAPPLGRIHLQSENMAENHQLLNAQNTRALWVSIYLLLYIHGDFVSPTRSICIMPQITSEALECPAPKANPHAALVSRPPAPWQQCASKTCSDVSSRNHTGLSRLGCPWAC